MVIPSIEEEEEVEVEEDGIGLMNDPQKGQMEVWKENFPVEMEEIRGEINQMCNARDQQNRQEDEWSVSESVERREDNTLRRESQRAPPTSPQLEDRFFTDWSSLDSPQTRTSPRNVSVRDIEQDGNQPNSQTIQSGLEPAQIEVMGNALHDSETSSITH